MSESSDKGGLSTLDLMGSTPSVNRVVRIMLKKPQMSYRELLDAVSQLPEEKRLSPDTLLEALQTLIAMGWLAQTGDGDGAVYNVVLKPKASSAEQLHSSDLPQIEVATDKKIDPGLKPQEASRPKPEGGISGFFNSLFGRKK